MAGYPYKALAILKYRPPPTQGPSISFDKGSIVTVLGAADDDGDWLEGENDQGVKGVFPATFVERAPETAEGESQIQAEGGESSSKPLDESIEEENSRALAGDSNQKDEAPAPAVIEQAAASISQPTTSPPPATSPPAVVESPDQSDPKAATAPSSGAKSPPPAPAKKPNALAARIAAFNQSQQTPLAPPPAPKPKVASKWTVGGAPSAPPPTLTDASSTASPPPAASPLPTIEQAVKPELPAQPKQFSAEDAQESIGRGGGSLRDRIKALQGLQIDQPAPPGRPPKPWKKKVTSEEEPEAPLETAVIDDTSIVKDQEPKHDVEVPKDEERVPEIPSFEPAEPASETPALSMDETASATSSRVQRDENLGDDEEASVAAAEKPSSIDLLAIAADSTPVVMTPGSASLEVPSSPSPFTPSTDKSPVSPQNEEEAVQGEEDSEAAKKQAIAARMAGLGGQKIGAVPIPALPKKAAGPRRNPRGGAKPAAPVNQPPDEAETPSKSKEVVIEQVAVDERNEEPHDVATEDAPLEQPGSKSVEGQAVEPEVAEESPKRDIFASMGGQGNSSLLRVDPDEDEDEHASQDDFDAPSAAAPPSRPPPTTESLTDPELEEGETQVEEKEFAQREETSEHGLNVSDQAVDSLPTPESADPTMDSNIMPNDEPAATTPVALNRPPVPPAFIRQPTEELPRGGTDDQSRSNQTLSEDAQLPKLENGSSNQQDHESSPILIPADVAGFRLPQEASSQRPPVPRHPAPPGHEKVTTDAEDRIMNETEVVTPPQEAFDESTAAPELTAPSVLDLAEVRDSHPESTDLSRQALPRPGRKEGEASPAPVASPRASSPERQQEEHEGDGGDEREDGEEEGEEEIEEEDPEVARRRAIAARMAKLGGMSMRMGPMIPPVGGLPPPSKKKVKKVKPEEVADLQSGRAIEAQDLTEQVVESQSSGTVTPDHPARRYGGIPSGGFALPGIAALRPQEENLVTQPETLPDEPAGPDTTDENADREDDNEEEVTAPPPLPAGRPLAMPPRRSVPMPAFQDESSNDDSQTSVAPVPEHTDGFVEEPEQHEQEEVNEMTPPPPPARPIGGHQDSIPPPMMSSVPSSPPTRAVPVPSKRESTLSLGRSTTRSSQLSSTVPATAAPRATLSPRQSLDSTFHAERVQGGGISPGNLLARDIDLDTQTGKAWWRLPNGLPQSLQGRTDLVTEYLSDSDGSKELEVIYADYSRTIIAIAYDPHDTTEATTSVSQNHFAPPGKPSLDILLHYSASLGAQIFAAAHLKANEKASRGLTDKQFVDFCFSKATEPVPPVGSTFGERVFEVSISSEGKKSFTMDEPRVGDVVVFRDVKLKQTLGSKTVGSHVAIVSGFDEKKSKLRVLEVDKNGASIDEGSYKLDDLKQGKITIYRVVGRDYL